MVAFLYTFSFLRTPVSSDFDVFVHAELRQGFFDAESRESGGAVGIPTLAHDLSHYA